MAENKNIEVGGRLHSIATGNVLAGANEILDDNKNKKQSQINTETDAALEDRYTKAETYNKTELNNMITTPNQEYGTYAATDQTTDVTDVLPATGEADTVYRVSNWDGSRFDPSVYSEYAWNGSGYVHLSTKTQIGEVFDISAYYASGGTLAIYDDLEDALGTNGENIHPLLRRGGMEVKFVRNNVHTNDNKYLQFRYMLPYENTTAGNAAFINPNNWQGVDENIIVGSLNLTESEAVAKHMLIKSVAIGDAVANTWTFNDVTLKEGTHYKVMIISGDKESIRTDNGQTSTNLAVYHKWYDFTPTHTGHPYFYISYGISESPIIYITTEEDIDYWELSGNIDDVNKYITGNINYKDIKVTEGADLFWRNNIYDGDAIPAGTRVKFTVSSGTNLISKFRVIDDSYASVIAETAYTAGKEFYAVLSRNTTMLGLYLSGSSIVGTGIVRIQLIVMDSNSIESKLFEKVNYTDIVNNLTQTAAGKVLDARQGKVLKDFIDTANANINNLPKDILTQVLYKCTGSVRASNQTMFFYEDFRVIEGETYYVKHISGYRNYFAKTNDDKVVLITGQWVEYTAGGTGTPYTYAGSVEGQEAPVVEIVGKKSLYELVTKVEALEKKVDDNVDETRVTSAPNQAGTVFIYQGGIFKKDVTYLVKLVSGYQGDIATIPEDAKTLVLGQYIEFTPATSNDVYTYTNPTTGKEAPVIQVCIKEKLVGRVAEVESELTKPLSKTTYINVSRDGTSKHGLNIQYSGLTAIADAINSITDASERNRYVIHVEGVFEFTDPLTVPMEGGGEYSIIYMKDYVDIEGDGPDNSVLIMDFPANAIFHDGKAYNDYQPIYLRQGQKVSGLKVIGKNCRYAFHIEQDGVSTFDKTIEVKNCEVEFRGAPDYAATPDTGNTFGTGITSGQIWNIKDCVIKSVPNGNAFSVHTPLSVFAHAAYINLENCIIEGRIVIANYQEGNNVFINIKNCSPYGEVNIINSQYWNTNVHSIGGDYNVGFVDGNTFKALYKKNNLTTDKGQVLRITSLSTGTTSVVRFNPESSAFDVIIGNPDETIRQNTKYEWNTQYGYVYRDGGVDLSGHAFGTIDVDEESSLHTSLASLLGDCSTTNKIFGISIDGTDYTITFNEDYSAKDNAYVLAAINTVIGAVATADLFCPAKLYYPKINGLKLIQSVDTGAILKGMGVVFISGGMRRAKSTDGYIDGICLDDTSNGQSGRVITEGYIYSQSQAIPDIGFTTYDTMSGLPSENIGKTLGINPDNDGQFKQDNSLVPLLRCKSDCLEIL